MGNYKHFLSALILITASIWLAVASVPQKEDLAIVSCDVGQGDASLVIYGSFQILIDGGPDAKVLDCLTNNLPFWDRTIEVVILTHPEADHYRGLVEVFERYQVEKLLAGSENASSQNYQLLKELVGGSQTKVIYPQKGLTLRYSLLQLDILYPNDPVFSVQSQTKSEGILGISDAVSDPNTLSIVAKLSWGDFVGIFPGDVPSQTLEKIVEENVLEDVNYIKMPHHGSRTGMTQNILNLLRPEVAVISAGKNNRFGHPHPEILEMLIDRGIEIRRTDQEGEIKLVFENMEGN